jgi:hypothetical protein
MCHCDSAFHANDECQNPQGTNAGPRYAIPSRSGPYLTGGRRYEIIGTEGTNLLIRCDRGHVRSISRDDGGHSAHLPPLRWQEKDFRYGTKDLGIFTFQG